MESESESNDTATQNPNLTTRMILRALARGWLLAVFAMGIIICLGVFYTVSQAKIYRAEAMVRLDPDPPRPLGHQVEQVNINPFVFMARMEFYQTELRIMRSRQVALIAVRKLSLHADPRFLGIPERKRADFKPVAPEEAADVLISRLSVELIKDSSLAYIRYEDTDKVQAKRILTVVVQAYIDHNIQDATDLSGNAAKWLNEQVETLRGELETSEGGLSDFRDKHNVLSVSLEDRHNMLTSQLEDISKKTTELSIKRIELVARSGQLARISGEDPEKIGTNELLSSSVLSTLRVAYVDQLRTYEEVTATLGEEHPKVKQSKARLDTAKQAVLYEIRNIKAAVDSELQSVTNQLVELKKRDEEVQKLAHDLQSLEIPFHQLERRKNNNEKLYTMVLERARETDMTRVMLFNNIREVEDPVEPAAPVRPNVVLNLLATLAIALVVGIGLALLKELTDQSIRGSVDIERAGLTVLGAIPIVVDKRKIESSLDLLVAEKTESLQAEAFRAVRTNLTFMSPDKPFKVLVVTSAIPSEGKSTVACSLATVLGQAHNRVLLVDTDLRRPRLHKTFGVANSKGVSMVVSGQATLEESIVQTPVSNVDFLPAGPPAPNPAEIIDSDRLRQMIVELRQKYDRVVFDSPPIMPVTDAVVLARSVDGVVLVVRTNRTHRTLVTRCSQILQGVNARIAGVVLNRVELSTRGYYGKGYYYGRYYGRYTRRTADGTR